MSTTAPFARIRRGTMAADRFTQIANDLFRDPRLSFKAKGIFGLLASHRDGYGTTPRRLAEQSTDGLDAIKTGLQELERHGYLVRHQERRPNGTLGPVEYLITDTPEPLPPSSLPVTENPPPVPTSGKTRNRRSQPVTDYPLARSFAHDEFG
ncbi:helix-turn-helix domain-containing protein [Streptacidiphilus anmyonensis]|uniref:helix-turn-helix domain-containing protein n=1 Tax=Streptacidiphilus anmyonensis TaxID=405782 RepID=UPI000694905A|nr:helix-turn-helix domain-containing protein [Streptacidiphilus anmyonensis]